MTSILKNLCWKEFHELKGSAVAATAIVLSIPLCYLFREGNDAFLAVYNVFCIYPPLAGVFFGMRAVAGERTNRTASFVAALPASHRLLGTARLLATIVAAETPLALLMGLGLALRPTGDPVLENLPPLYLACGASMFATTCLLTIVAVAGLGQQTEIRAGAAGIIAIVGVVALAFFALLLLGVIVMALGLEREFENAISGEMAQHSVIACGTSLLIALPILLFVVFTNRYSHALGPFTPGTAKRWSVAEWRPAAVPAHVSALIWKGVREMAILGLEVFLVSLLLSLVAGVLGLTGTDPMTVTDLVTKTLPGVLWVGGFVLAVLVGVGAVIGDVQGGVNTFWRSRPIPPQAWYWTKYLIGLATILLAVEIPLLISIGSVAFDQLRWLLLWNTTFSFALTATCLVRQPAHAAILAVGAAGILYAIVEAAFGSLTPGEPAAPLIAMAPVFLFAFVASTFLGSWAAEHDVAIS